MKRISAPVWMMASFIAGIVFVHSCGKEEESVAQSSSSAEVTGLVIAFAGGSTPSGYLACDGSAVSRTTYADLFAAIGTAWGVGDGSTTFNLPDLRGRFLRGVDGAAGNDPDAGSRTVSNAGGNAGDLVGSLQADAFQGHWHEFKYTVGGYASGGNPHYHAYSGTSTTNTVANPTADNLGNGTPRTASESRPKNAYVSYLIKS